jgi:uncharacterized protein
MRISTRKIPVDGLDVEFQISSAVMTANQAQHDDLKEMFREDVNCQLHLDLSDKDVFVQGEAHTSIHPICARCDETFDQDFRIELTLTCSPQPPAGGSKDSYQESEEGLVYYRHEELDLSEIVREQVLLSLAMKYLCKNDCRGLCPRCGWNLNSGDHVCAITATKH